MSAASNLQEFTPLGVDPTELITFRCPSGSGDDRFYGLQLVEVLFASLDAGWLIQHVTDSRDLGVMRDRTREYADHWFELHGIDADEFGGSQRGRALRSADAAEVLLDAGATGLDLDPFTVAELEARGWVEPLSEEPMRPASWPEDPEDAAELDAELRDRLRSAMQRFRA